MSTLLFCILSWTGRRFRESLPQLRCLSITHLAANTFFAAPEVTWSDLWLRTAHEVDLLVAALPQIQRVQLRCGGLLAHPQAPGRHNYSAAPAPQCTTESHALACNTQPDLAPPAAPAGCLSAAWQRSMPLARASCCTPSRPGWPPLPLPAHHRARACPSAWAPPCGRLVQRLVAAHPAGPAGAASGWAGGPCC